MNDDEYILWVARKNAGTGHLEVVRADTQTVGSPVGPPTPRVCN